MIRTITATAISALQPLEYTKIRFYHHLIQNYQGENKELKVSNIFDDNIQWFPYVFYQINKRFE